MKTNKRNICTAGMLAMALALALALALVMGCSMENRAHGKAYVLTVGIDYSNSSVATLRGCVRDALEFAACYGVLAQVRGVDHVVTPLIAQAPADMDDAAYPSMANILSAIAATPATADDLFIFYYSGHGTIDEQTGRTYLVTAPTKSQVAYELLDSQVLLDAISDKGCQAAIVLDCCNSGGIAGGVPKPMTFAQAFVQLAQQRTHMGVQAMCASQSDQLSYETSVANGDEVHGKYTAALLEAMGWQHSPMAVASYEAGSKVYTATGNPTWADGMLATNRQVTVRQLHEMATSLMPEGQQPLVTTGKSAVVLLPGRLF